MRNNVLTVMKKEFSRFFGDRRMVLMMLLPAVLVYVIYSFMGTALASIYAPDESSTRYAYAVNMPDDVAQIVTSYGVNVLHIGADEVAGVKDKVMNREAELCIVFPDGFHDLVIAYDVMTATGPAPNVEVYYNSIEPNSQDAYGRVIAALDAYESSMANKFDINRGVEEADVSAAEDRSATFISSLMPMLLMIFLYSGCMGLAPDAIAGEKERGTIATLLVTPLKRSELATGKILSLAVLSFLSGLITAVATIAALPNMMGGAEDLIDTGIYGATDYAMLVLVILSTILLLVALISIISAFAKTVKEANTAVTPFLIPVMLVGVTGMFGGGAQSVTAYYMIPLYGSVQSMNGIFSLGYSPLNVAISCISNLVLAVIGGFILTKMFNSEKIMFAR